MQLDDIRRDIKSLAASASSRPSAGAGEAPEGDPQVERLAIKGTKRKAASGPEPDILPNLGAAIAKPTPVVVQADASAPASITGSEQGGVVSATNGAKYPGFTSVLYGWNGR